MKASDNPFPSALFEEQASAPTTPPSGFWRAYFKSDGLYVVDDAGNETGPFGAGGGGGTTIEYVGKNAIGASQETMTNKRVYAKKVTIATACVITDIEAYIDFGAQNDVVNSFAVGLYTDNAGTPDNLIQQNFQPNQSTLLDDTNGAGGNTTARWFGLPLGRPVTAGDYWLAFMAHWSTGLGAARLSYDGSGSDRYYGASGAWLTDWGWTAPTTTTNDYSIRANTIR